ncbi:MAG: hypothetical protein COB76_01125 [Alphaproteobacteria bacterium]|nr:MAG: hypothetical protein COB76_01125 [Alphaproteobacteria bacterium]
MVEKAAVESGNKSKFYEVVNREIAPIVEAINAGIKASGGDTTEYGLDLDYCKNAMFLITLGHDEIYRDHITELGYRANLADEQADTYYAFQKTVSEVRPLIDGYENPKTVAKVLAKAIFQEAEHNFNADGYTACLNKLGQGSRMDKISNSPK